MKKIIYLLTVITTLSACNNIKSNSEDYDDYNKEFIETGEVVVDFNGFGETGIDLSHHNGIDENKWNCIIEQVNPSFCFVKASGGARFKDEDREKIYKFCKTSSVKFGAYHFFKSKFPVEDQFNNWLSATSGLELDLLPVIDFEREDSGEGGFIGANPTKSDIEKLIELNELFYNKYGKYPIIYTNIECYYILKEMMPNHLFWIAGIRSLRGQIQQFISTIKYEKTNVSLDIDYVEDLSKFTI